MKVPNLEKAEVPAAKIANYLLSETHPDGKHKARFFRAVGCSLDDGGTLEKMLLKHLAEHEVAKVERTTFGTRYVVEGIIEAPDGRLPLLRTVWFIGNEEEVPQFVSAYPLRRREDG
jgi:hypothetical protein